jgi:hypothetical protein
MREAEIRHARQDKVRVALARKDKNRQRRNARKQRLREDRERQKETKRLCDTREVAAALQLQMRIRMWILRAKLQLRKKNEAAAMMLQKFFRGWMVRVKFMKEMSARERAREKKLGTWRAITTIVICLSRWLKRSRDRRWRGMLREVLRAYNSGNQMRQRRGSISESWAEAGRLQEGESDEDRDDFSPVENGALTHDGRAQKAKASSLPSSPSKRNLRVSKTSRMLKRRGSVVSAITSFKNQSTAPDERTTCQRVSIVEKGDHLGIEIQHVATGNITVIDVGYFLWARVGLGRLEDLTKPERQQLHQVLLSYCLMQTGRLGALSIFDPVPALRTAYEQIANIAPNAIEQQKKGGKDAEIRTPSMILAERLSMHIVKQGAVLFEQGTIGNRVYFIRSGKVEFLAYKGGLMPHYEADASSYDYGEGEEEGELRIGTHMLETRTLFQNFEEAKNKAPGGAGATFSFNQNSANSPTR